jgi:hypothetical protein
MDPIQLPGPDPVQQNPISIDTGGLGDISVNPKIASVRASKASLGLSQVTGMSQGEIQDLILSGKEGNFRDNAAAQLDRYNIAKRNQVFQQGLVQGVPLDQLNQIATSYNRTDPSTVIETSFANHYVNPLLNRTDPFISNTSMRDAQREIPQQVDSLADISSRVIAKQQYYQTLSEGVDTTLQNQSRLGWWADQIKNMFQPYVEFKMRGLTDQANTFAEGMLGSTLKAEADDINRLPLEQAKPKLDAIVEKLKNDNPTLAHQFLAYVMHSQDASPNLDNFWTATMAAGMLGGIARKIGLFKQATQAARDLTEGAKDVGSAIDNPDIARWENAGGAIPPEVSRPAAHGDLEEAAVKKATIDVTKDVIGTSNPTQRALEALPDLYKKQIRDNELNPGNHGQELVNRINQGLSSRLNNVIESLKSQLRPNRIPDITKSEELTRTVLEQERTKYPGIAGNIMNVKGFFHEPISNTWTYDLIFGQNDATFFKSEGEAIEWANDNRIPLTREELEPIKMMGKFKLMPFLGKRPKIKKFGAEVRNDGAGSGWYIAKNMPFDETQPGLKQFYGQTESSKAPTSFIRSFTSWISTPEDTQSRDQRINKMLSTEGPAHFYDLMRNNINELKKLSRSQANDLETILESLQNKPDPNNNGIPGTFARSIGDLDDEYLRVLNRLPEDSEVAAYFEFRGNYIADQYFRIASKMRIKSRLGGKSVQAVLEDDDKNVVRSPAFEGKLLSELPIGSKEGGSSILITKRHIDHTVIGDTSKIAGDTRKEMIENIKTGKASLYEILNPDEHPLTGFGGVEDTHRIRYVYAYKPEENPLDWLNQVPTRGGGHLDQEYDHYLSQANIYWDSSTKTHNYVGDTNLHPLDNSMTLSQKKAVMEKYDNVRKLIEAGNEDGARRLATDPTTAIPIDYDRFRSDFETSTGPGGKKIKPRLSKSEPIQLRPKDKQLIDLGRDRIESRFTSKKGKTTLVDGTRQGNLLRTSAVQYTGERDAYEVHAIQDRGSLNNPLYQIAPAQHINAIPMMNRALGRIINSLYMDDYKTSAIDHWLFGAQVADPLTGKMHGAANYLKAKNLSEILHSPFTFFNDPEFRPGTPIEVKSALLADRMKIRQFMGTPSVVDTALHSIEQKLADSIHGKFGPKAMKLSPLWHVSSLSDAPRVLRSIIYNTKMGFFSPRQFFIHAFTFINGMLISPMHAPSGAFASMLHGWSYLNASENVLKHMDELAQKMGFRPGEWLEAREGMFRTNFNSVEKGQLALVDNPMSNNIIKNKGEQFLDAGMLPFRGGVKSLKTASWFTAYKEWRAAHPTGRITDAEWGDILLRANDLSHNMSRASTSAVQKGLVTFGAMFSSYNLRLAELLLGKRLSVAEKSRLFLGYMTLFGVPTGAGIFGLSTLIRKNVNEGNVPGMETYVPGYSTPSTLFMEGALSTLVGTISGGGDIQKGNIYNIGESYGAKDLDFIEKSLSGDTNMWQAFGGALYSTFSSAWANSDGYRNAISSMWRQDGQFKMSPEDMINPLREISSVNYAWKTYMGWETGKWMSRNNSYLEPTSPGNALFMGISGLSSEAESDMYTKSLSAKDNKAAIEQTMREYGKVMQQYIQAVANNDPDNAERFGKNAAWILNGIPEQMKAEAVAQAYRDNQDLISRTNFQNATSKDIPDAEKNRRMDIYNKQLQLRQKQGLQ